MGFYLAVGMIGMALAMFVHYAGHLALKRRRNAFEHRMCMLTACVWCVLGWRTSATPHIYPRCA